MVTSRYVCRQCDHDEDGCECNRYCILCYGEDDVRLCEDGSFYCANCREVCDYMAQP